MLRRIRISPIPSQKSIFLFLFQFQFQFQFQFRNRSPISNHNASSRNFSSSENPGPLARYKEMVDQGRLRYDPHQEKVAVELEKLMGRLGEYEKEMEEYYMELRKWEEKREAERRKLLVEEAEEKERGGGIWNSVNKRRSNLLDRWMVRKRIENVEPGVGRWVSYLNRERKLDSLVGHRPTAPPAPKGLYIYGNVGSGKTMLMDMFYSATEGIVKHRRRFHFHEAMLNINEHMHKIWKSEMKEKSFQSSISSWIMTLPFDAKVKEWLAAEETYKKEMQMKNILPAVADKFLVDQLADERGASILCFDEIQIADYWNCSCGNQQSTAQWFKPGWNAARDFPKVG